MADTIEQLPLFGLQTSFAGDIELFFVERELLEIPGKGEGEVVEVVDFVREA
jgi:hypothetical protein